MPIVLRRFALIRKLVAFIRSTVPFISGAAPHLEVDLALVGFPVALVRCPVSLGRGTLVVLADNHSFTTIPRRGRARDGESPLHGDVQQTDGNAKIVEPVSR